MYKCYLFFSESVFFESFQALFNTKGLCVFVFCFFLEGRGFILVFFWLVGWLGFVFFVLPTATPKLQGFQGPAPKSSSVQ